MAKVEILAAAQAEYQAAASWYRDRSLIAARRLVAEVEAAIASIGEHPDRHPRWDDNYRFRLLSKFPYYVAYRQTSQTIVIVAIRHAAQDAKAWTVR